jgi:hypothetical protein
MLTSATTKSRWGLGLALVIVASVVLLSTAPASGIETGPQPVQVGTWVGGVERSGDERFHYVGRACPVEEEACILVLARYRIVPLTGQAAEALPQVAGRQARSSGVLVASPTSVGLGTLFVWSISTD